MMVIMREIEMTEMIIEIILINIIMIKNANPDIKGELIE